MNSKRCAMDCNRPVTSDSPESQLCAPCLEEAEQENAHSDHGHSDEIDSLTLKQTNLRTKKALEAHKAEVKAEMETCWVCHPEFNKAKQAYTPRIGTSRQGIVLSVPPKADPKTKAQTVAEKIGYEHGTAKVRTLKGTTTLAVGDIKLAWDAQGRFLSTGSIVNGKKVRNVSEALRLLAA